jgi:hypothetical protein
MTYKKLHRHARGDEARKPSNRFGQQAPCQCGALPKDIADDAFVGTAMLNRMHDEFSYTPNRVNANAR